MEFLVGRSRGDDTEHLPNQSTSVSKEEGAAGPDTLSLGQHHQQHHGRQMRAVKKDGLDVAILSFHRIRRLIGLLMYRVYIY